MQITETITNRISDISGRSLLVGICGRAGAGKSTLAAKIKGELEAAGIKSISYSGDWRFKLDSQGRKSMMAEKWLSGLDEYLRAINQFNWWDFEKISSDLDLLKSGQKVFLENIYDRETGKKDASLEIQGIKEGVIFYENCILGGVEVLNDLDIVVLLNTPDDVCFSRLLAKDLKRRSFPDMLARQLVTIYSENIFFHLLLEKFQNKLLVCGSDGIIGEFPKISEVSQIPVPLADYKGVVTTKGAVFCNLDGTLVENTSQGGIELIEGSQEKLKELKEKGYYLVLTTSRPYHTIFGILNKLKSQGVAFDQVVSDLPLGSMHLIHNDHDGRTNAVVHPLKTNEGIKNIRID
jgi:uridine kinase